MKKDTSAIKGDDSDNALTPAELIKKHIKDPKHLISDEEMKNLIVGNEVTNDDDQDKEPVMLADNESVGTTLGNTSEEVPVDR